MPLGPAGPARRSRIAYPPPAVSLLEDIKQYIGFGSEDAAVLAELLPLARPHLPAVAKHFYDLILAHPSAHAAITGGPAQVERLKRTLVDWMESGLAGPHDESYWQRRARIGRVHVEIGLPQRYMFTAMNVIRLDFRRIVEDELLAERPGRPADLARARRTSDALDRLFDMELAIMLHAYQEDSERRLQRRERLATIGQIAASIGHELRNPLGIMQSSLYLLGKRVEGPGGQRHLDKLAAQIRRCDRIISGLLELSREQPARRQPLQLAEMVEEIREELAPQLPSTLTVSAHAPDDLGLSADPELLRLALVNLILNAAQTPGVTQVAVRGERDGEQVRIEVRDDGPGFAPETLPVAFDPLTTTRPRGTGLGLPLVQTVATRHGGHAEVANTPGGGACVTMVLPVSPG